MNRNLKYLLVVTVLAVFLFRGTCFAQSESGAVFRELEWGGTPSSIANAFSLSGEEPGIDLYRSRTETLSLGSFPIESITYSFFDDQLFRIKVISKDQGEDGYDGLLLMLNSRYGEPTRRPFFGHTRGWDAPDTKITLVWELLGNVFFALESQSIKAKYDAWYDQYKKDQAASNAQTW